MATRDRIRSVPEELLAPVLVAIGLVPFVVELWGTAHAPPLLFGAVMVSLATATVALGTVRLGAAVLAVALASFLSALRGAEVGETAASGVSVSHWTLLGLALAFLVWSARSGEGERLREFVQRRQ